MMASPPSLNEVLFRSSELHERFKAHIDSSVVRLNSGWNQWRLNRPGFEHIRQRVRDVLVNLLDRCLAHPVVEKCEKLVLNCAAAIYAKCMPILAELSRNSLLAGAVGFFAGLTVASVAWSILYNRHKSPMKSRPMSGAICDATRYYGLESLQLRGDLDIPRVTKPDQVLVRVHAASVDHVDVLILNGYGRNERRNKKSVILGRDFSGVVMEVGRRVNHTKVGDAVWSAQPVATEGVLCEFVVVPGHTVRLKPPHLGHDGACTVPYSGLAVWKALVQQGQYKPHSMKGKSVLVVDGATATGCIAIQVVKAWGGRVVTCVPYRVAPLVHKLGADRIIPVTPDVDAEDKSRNILHDESPFDLCIMTTQDSMLSEPFCQQYSDKMVQTFEPQTLNTDCYGFIRRYLLSYLRVLSKPHHYLDVSPLDHLAKMVDKGQLQPVLDSAYAFEQAEEAFQATATQATIGKTIVTFGAR